KAIKSEGGITFAQDSQSAKYAAMPENAIVAGAVDFVLSPRKIAAELVKLAHFVGHPPPAGAEAGPAVGPADNEKPFKEIITLLRSATGINFSNYNPNTIQRRILRRMALSNIQNMAQYAESLRNNSSELRSLYEDIFIHVTNFFRNPDRFEALKSRIYPAIVENKKPGESIRIWCAGCSTGEEAFSLAITLVEYMSANEDKTPIQIFATDISETAINKARAATYPTNIEAHVSLQRLKRFFVKHDTGYQISKQVRELCVFTKHDVTNDPPFSRLDLISCSNVLIYFVPSTQKKILATFHYALKPSGFLILGKSESVGNLLNFYESLDNKHKIYSRKEITTSNLALGYSRVSSQHVVDTVQERPSETGFDLQREADQLVLARYGHRGLLLDDKMRILQFRGVMGRLLAPGSGEATLNLTAMLHEDLRIPVHVLIEKAGKQNQTVFKKNVPVRIDKILTRVSVEVIPITNRFDQQRFFLVLLEEEYPRAERRKTANRKGAAKSADGIQESRIK
ncbi:MAG TPA: CheR family methyltransferase, partial [Acidobacteriota bacterium]|nr:CheR family methyltransferase [Acidobacteriota bacterium]